MLKTLSALLAAVAIATATTVHAAGPQVGEHNQVQPLPINGMVAAVKNGKLAFVSSNGRFVFQGTVYDTWNKKDVTTIAEAKFANEYLDLEKLKFEVDELAPMVVGKGEKEVVVFYDPYCPSCHQLIEDIEGLDGYTFKFVAIPVMGNDSSKAVRFAFCSPDKEMAKKVLLGQVKPSSLPSDKFETCDTGPLAKRVISSQLFGLVGVPFLVRDDGLVRNGYQKGEIANWLEAGK